MNNIYKTHFTTGEFAKICNVKKQTLFHYDDIGIFSPEIKTETGYRYYSVSQLEVFNVISSLKELDMPLKDIKEYLEKRTPNEFINLLQNEMEIINKKISNLQRMHKAMKKKIEVTKLGSNIDVNEISLINLEDTFLICTTSRNSKTAKDIALSIADHVNYCERNNIYSSYSIGGLLSLASVSSEIYNNYTCFYNELDYHDKNKSNFIKEKGVYLTAYHKGGYYTTDITYKKILKFAKDNNLTIKSNFYEEPLLDDLSVKGYENYVLKISALVL